MQDAIILGGGISGLTAAYLLQQEGLEISVIEKGKAPGGPIQSSQENGYLVEHGPNSLLLPNPWVENFINQLGLGNQLQLANPTADKRYIVKNDQLVPVPASPLQAITTPLFSLAGKLGFLGEPFRRQISDKAAATETVASFVTRRMGKDFLNYAIDPFVSGVYAGDPHKLILEHAFPLMRGFEKDSGSIIRGAISYRKRRKAEGTAYKKKSVSFRKGLGILPQTIARKLGNHLWLDSEVVAVNRNDQGWQVTWKRDGENFEGFAKRLIVCLPSYATKRIAWTGVIAKSLQQTPDLPYPAVHSLALGFKRDQIQHALDGFGALVPSIESLNLLGVLFSSAMYPNRAPEGHCLLTVMIGGIRHPELANATQDQLLEIAMADLRPLLGIAGDPTYIQHTASPKAIPQYTADFAAWRDTLHNLEEEFSGLHFGGNSIDGIAMGASILSGKRLAETCLNPSK